MRIKLNPVNLVFYLLLMAMVLRPANGHAQKEFVIKSVNTQLNETVYFLNAVFEINLPDYIVKAFEQGFEIPLFQLLGFNSDYISHFNTDRRNIKASSIQCKMFV